MATRKPSLKLTLAGIGLTLRPGDYGQKLIMRDRAVWWQGTAHEVSRLLLSSAESYDLLAAFVEQMGAGTRAGLYPPEIAELVERASALVDGVNGERAGVLLDTVAEAQP